ncbi:MAG: creatininase family protein [Chloroflexota bacterium]|nr:MAG: creatininase family protein [Chloroflexota bacterium]
MPSVYLEHLTWVQAEKAFREIPIVLLPIGAILKEHGPHLPLNTDYLIARDLARRVAEQTDVIVCPPVTFGYYPAFVHFPGSVNLASDTFRETVEQIILSLSKNGAQRFLLLNTGVSTTAPLTLAANNLVAQNIRVALANILELGKRADAVIENESGSHANEHETSMLLAIDSTVVKMENAVAEIQLWMNERGAPVREAGPLLRSQDGVGVYCPSGVIGDPTRATREKGEAILRAMADDVVAFCKNWE